MGEEAKLYVDVEARTNKLKASLNKLRGESERDAEKIGKDFGKGMVRGADGKLRNSRGQFVKMGKNAGNAVGRGFSGNFTKNINKGLNKISGSMKKWGKRVLIGGMMGGAAGILLLLKKSLGMSTKQEAIFRKLQTAVELTGVKYADVKDKITAFLDAMQKTTKYGDTDMAPALQTIINLTGNVSKGLEGSKIAADIASTGLFNLETASRYVAMAMSGEVTMLGRYIPELKEAALAEAGITTKAEKTAYALGILRKKFGGASEKDLNTFNGRWKQLKNYLGDILERVGDLIAVRLKPKLDSWVASIQNWIAKGGLEEFANNLSIVFGNLAKVIEKAAKGINKIVNFAAKDAIKQKEAALSAYQKTLTKLTTESPGLFQKAGRALNKFFGVDKQKEIDDTKRKIADLTKEIKLLKQEAINTTAGNGGNSGYINPVKTKKDIINPSFGPRVNPSTDGLVDIKTPSQDTVKALTDMNDLINNFNNLQYETFSSFQEGIMGAFEAIKNGGNVWQAMADAFIKQVERMIAEWLAFKMTMMLMSIIPGGGGSIVQGGSGTGVAHEGGEFVGTNTGVMKLAGGGNFIVPPGFNNDSFPLLVETGERVRVTPSNQAGKDIQLLYQINDSIQAMNMNMILTDKNLKVNIDGVLEAKGQDLKAVYDKSTKVYERYH